MRDKSHSTVSTYHNIWRERRAEADSNRSPSAYQPNALPLGHTGSQLKLLLVSWTCSPWLLSHRTASPPPLPSQHADRHSRTSSQESVIARCCHHRMLLVQRWNIWLTVILREGGRSLLLTSVSLITGINFHMHPCICFIALWRPSITRAGVQGAL